MLTPKDHKICPVTTCSFWSRVCYGCSKEVINFWLKEQKQIQQLLNDRNEHLEHNRTASRGRRTKIKTQPMNSY